MKCAPCTIEMSDGNHGEEQAPEAVTQIGGTAVCAKCAKATADAPGAGRDAALRPVLMRRRGRPERPERPQRGAQTG